MGAAFIAAGQALVEAVSASAFEAEDHFGWVACDNRTTRTIANWRASGKIPYLRITARCFRYDLDQVARALSK